LSGKFLLSSFILYHFRSPSPQALVPQGFQFRKKIPHFPGSFLTFLWSGFSYTSFVCASLHRSRIDFIRLRFSIACRTCLMRNLIINLIGSSCTSLVCASLRRSRIDFIRLRFSIACRTCLMRNLIINLIGSSCTSLVFASLVDLVSTSFVFANDSLVELCHIRTYIFKD